MKTNATGIITLPRANYHANFTKHINYLFTLLLLLDDDYFAELPVW